LHASEQNLDGLLSEILAFFSEAVSLVNEEDAIQSGIDDGICPRCGLAHILCDQSGAVAFNQMALPEDAERFVNSAHQPSHGSFAGTGIAGVDGVIRRWNRLEPLPN